MPEAPDLYILQEFLEARVAGRKIMRAAELQPLVVRNLTEKPFMEGIIGSEIQALQRRGKLLMFSLSHHYLLIVSPMLTGKIDLVAPSERMLKSTVVTFDLDDDMQVRYLDSKRMGQIYYLPNDRISEVTRLEDQGPDVFDQPYTLQQFKAALNLFRGEVKGVLTRGQLVAGIGNAYADEILWDAGIYPFKKIVKLSDDEVEALHNSLYSVTADAVDTLRGLFGDDGKTPRKERGFLKVHGRAGNPCPKCRVRISSVKAKRRESNFCRSCQPGSLFQ